MEKDKDIINISMVIVTYNRLEKLKKAINSIYSQKFLPKNLIIVNNASTDSTKEYLDTLPKNVTIINNEKNLGGSGGFYIGEVEAKKKDADWIWLSDDDAYLENGLFEKLDKILPNVNENIGAICTKVSNSNSIDFLHRRVLKKGLFKIKEIPVSLNDYSLNKLEIDEFSYVGTLIRKSVLEEIGLVNKDFFIWFDDTEHSIRLRKKYKIELYPELNVFHDCEEAKSNISWKNYYGYRNLALIYKWHFGLWYYLFYKIRTYIKILLSKDKKTKKILQVAFKDAKKNKLGKSDIYYPGCNI